MFQIGDAIIYPMHGAGKVTAIEQKILEGKKEDIYVIGIPKGNLTIRIPVENVSKMGIRKVTDKKEIQEIFGGIELENEPIFSNWNKRYKNNLEKIRTGRFEDVAQVYKQLKEKDEKKGLSNAEKNMLLTTKQIILSEIALSYEIKGEEVEDLLANLAATC